MIKLFAQMRKYVGCILKYFPRLENILRTSLHYYRKKVAQPTFEEKNYSESARHLYHVFEQYNKAK
jgi:hypothetical protein